jgi:hypothetical protein
VSLYAGVYEGGAPELVRSSCAGDLPAFLSADTFPHTVNQKGETVALDEADGTHWEGELRAEGGFAVTRGRITTGAIGDVTFFVIPTIVYQDFKGAEAAMAVIAGYSCTTGVLCSAEWRARVTRRE